MNDTHLFDLLRINDALSCLFDLTDLVGSDERIKLEKLSCLIWLSADKLDHIMDEILVRQEQLEKDAREKSRQKEALN